MKGRTGGQFKYTQKHQHPKRKRRARYRVQKSKKTSNSNTDQNEASSAIISHSDYIDPWHPYYNDYDSFLEIDDDVSRHISTFPFSVFRSQGMYEQSKLPICPFTYRYGHPKPLLTT